MLEKVLRGRTYVKVVNDQDRHIAITPARPRLDIRDTQMLHFFSRAEIHFTDSKPLRLPAPTNSLLRRSA